MSDAFNIKETEDKITIEILPNKRSIVKTILLLKAIGFSLSGLFLGLYILNQLFERPILTLVILIICGVLFLAGFNYFKKYSHKEIIEIDDENLSIFDKYLFFTKEKLIPKNEISLIKYKGNVEYTKHPLESNTIDYTGLATGEKEVQFLAENGTIELHSDEGVILFGDNLPSWDSEVLIEIIKDFLKR